ncbi:reverse transcriptase (RNA-dependent DNA polymerase) domain-containing protein, partial [Penicillium sp. IBT 16267x]
PPSLARSSRRQPNLSSSRETPATTPESFGARRRRSCEQALNIPVEKIHDAWREGKVLSLVSFNVKDASNGIDRTALLRRLRERRILFCSSRRASIIVNMYQPEEMAIEQAGLPQGSPLSPVLFLLLNANLVEVSITRRKGAIAFVEITYTRWIVGPSVETNTTVLQQKVIPRALEWASQSSAAFEAKKTSFIHFTRNQRQLVNGATVAPAPKVKILA